MDKHILHNIQDTIHDVHVHTCTYIHKYPFGYIIICIVKNLAKVFDTYGLYKQWGI